MSNNFEKQTLKTTSLNNKKLATIALGLPKKGLYSIIVSMNAWDFAVFVMSRIPFERFFTRDGVKAVGRFEESIKERQVAPTTELPPSPQTPARQEEIPSPIIEPAPQGKPRIATACVACAVGHFSTSSGLLKEALRFKGEGITSDEILDRIAASLEEQNALEREDLTQEKIQRLPKWERKIAEEALTQSRQLRHQLETIQTIEELEQLAADTRTYYLSLSRQWYKGRFANLGAEKADAISQRVGG